MLILLADDHELVREGLKHTLTGLSPDVTFLEASTATEVIDAIFKHTGIDLLLLDLVMPGSNGFQLLKQICDNNPDLPVVVLSAADDPAQMRKALDVGASGFISKSGNAEVMLSALRLILAGGIYVPPDMLKPYPDTDPRAQGIVTKSAAATDPQTSVLTARQRQVLEKLGQGKSNKQIARELDLSENTVKIHVTGVLRALGVDNRTQAAVIAGAKRQDAP